MSDNAKSSARDESSSQPEFSDCETEEIVTFGDFLKLAERLRTEAPEEFEGFMENRVISPPSIRDPFEDWEE